MAIHWNNSIAQADSKIQQISLNALIDDPELTRLATNRWSSSAWRKNFYEGIRVIVASDYYQGKARRSLDYFRRVKPNTFQGQLLQIHTVLKKEKLIHDACLRDGVTQSASRWYKRHADSLVGEPELAN